jgi:hypothetical protein
MLRNQINLDGFFVRVFTNLEIAFVFSFILGGNVDNQGSVWGASLSSEDQISSYASWLRCKSEQHNARIT